MGMRPISIYPETLGEFALMTNKMPTFYPLSSPQREIWFDQKLHPDVPLYNIGGYLRIDGSVDVTIFEQALNQVIKDNDALRIILHEGKTLPIQEFAPNIRINLDFYDFSVQENAHKQALAWMEREFVKLFQLYEGLLFQFALCKISDKCYYWFKKYHHLIVDGWAMSLIVQRVAQAYNTAEQPVDEQNLYSYQDFIKNDQAYLKSEEFSQHKHYWQEKYQQLPEPSIPRQGYRSIKCCPSMLLMNFLIGGY